LFLLTGFAWLVLAALLGSASLIGLVLGTPLPPWLRLVHTHAALVGGVAQMMLGGFLVFIPPVSTTRGTPPASHPVVFLAINAGTVVILLGFWLKQNILVGAAGFLVIGAFLWMARDIWTASRDNPDSVPHRWSYAVALLALVGGLVGGETMALNLAPESYGHVRLSHIHLNLLGFVILTIIGIMHQLLPAALKTALYSPRLSQIVMVLMTLGSATLIGGFMLSSVPIELAAGGLLLIGVTLYSVNLFRTWQVSGHSGNAASDHLLIGTFFLQLTTVLGLFVAWNSLSERPVLPFGTLHLIAYTHMALVGFLLNTSMGVLSHRIPLALAAGRISSPKKRGPYLEQLMTMMDRWRAVQIGGLSLGTVGLALLASLTWNVPLSSPYILAATWGSFALLLGSLVFYCAKLAYLYASKPQD
jgi:hypothetical protein